MAEFRNARKAALHRRGPGRFTRPARAARTGFAAAVALAALLALTAGSLASAEPTFIVNSTSDALDARVGDRVCATSAGKCTLRAAIQEANARSDADVIQLPSGTYAITLRGSSNTTGDFDITRPLTIIGGGAGLTIVDAGQPPAGSPPEHRGLDRLFEIHSSAGNVSIDGVALQEGYAAELGGAIQHASPGTLSLRDVTVRDSYAGKYGGGVNNAGRGRVEIFGSILSGNGAVEGGAAVNNAAAGTVVLDETAVLDNPGSYLRGAGAIHNQGLGEAVGTIVVENSTVSGNEAISNGAGISNDGDGSIRVATSRITGNRTSASGGGIYTTSGPVTVADTTISDNHAGDGVSTGNGGGIYSVGERTKSGLPARIEITRATMSANSASGDGGGIGGDLEAELLLADSTVSNNVAGSDGGGVSSQTKATAVVTGVVFSDNRATSRAGGLYAYADGTVTIEDARFSRNTAGGDGGGGLYTDGSGAVSVAGSTFSENEAVGHGGGIAIHSSGNVTVTDTNLRDNESEAGGGGVLNSGMRVTFTRVTVAGNTAHGGAAGIGDGGGIENESSAEFVMVDSTIAENAGESGGGFANAADGALRISGSTLRDNTARQVGGGFVNRNDAPTAIENSTFSGNAADLGGGFANRSDAGTELMNSTVSGNAATTSGGGFHGDADADLRLVNVTITRNSAPTGSGVGFASQSPNVPVIATAGVILRNTLVAGNLQSPDCDAAVASEGGNLESGNSCYLRGPSDLINADPRLEPLADNGGSTQTHALTTLSPGVDGGVEPCPATDQRGLPRPQDEGCDIGAFELEGTPPGPEPTPDCGAPITVAAVADSWIDQSSPASTNGTDSVLKVQSKGPSANFRALVHFGVPSPVPEGCEVASATLRLYAGAARGGRVLQALPVAGDWSEDQVTWSNQPPTTGAAATAASGLGYVQWDVTAAVAAVHGVGANHGFLIRDAVEGRDAEQSFYSREKGENAPKLVLTFAPAGD